jgi:hypothetical protein
MMLTPLETVGLAGFFAVAGATITKIWMDRKSRDCLTVEELEVFREELDRKCLDNRAHCTGAVISHELKGIRALLSVLCERGGISVREQQEIVRDAK